MFLGVVNWGGIADSLPSVFVAGIFTAAVYFIAASGLVVTYQTTGVFNMAHGAIGMLSAFTYWQLVEGKATESGPLAFVHPQLPAWLAALIVVVIVAPLIGAALEVFIFRRLAGALLSTTLVVTVGLIAASLTIANQLFPAQSRRIDGFFAGENFELFGTTVTGHQALEVGLAILVAIGLWALFHFSRIGVAMRAVVDSRSLSALNGIPSQRVAISGWALGCGLAGLAGVLTASHLPLQTTSLTLLVINAYAAAIVGRLKSLPMTVVGALVLGWVEVFIQKDLSLFYDRGEVPLSLARLGDVVPIIVLFVVLMVLPSERVPTKQPVGVRLRQPSARYRFLIAAGFVAAAWLFAFFMIGENSTDDLLKYGPALSIGLIVLSLVPLTGWGGQISLAQLMLAGVGAWIAAVWGVDGSLFGLVGAIAITTLVGALIAIPAIRLQGIYLALATLAIAVFADKMFFPQEGVFYGGGRTVEVPRFGPIHPTTPRAYFVYMAIVFAIVGLILSYLKSGSLGRRISAMRDAPAAAATLGMSTTRVKLTLFMISAAIAGLGGVVFGGMRGGVSENDFGFASAGLPILLLAVIGGISTVSGALVGGIVFALIGILITKFPDYTWVFNLLPATIGISMAQNPDGTVPSILRRIPGSSLKSRTRAEAVVAVDESAEERNYDEAEAAGIALGLEGVLRSVSGR